MLTKRDKEILKFINVFGKTYYEVLGKTFFKNIQSARNRITVLKKKRVISYKKTGLESPKRALTLGPVGKEYVDVVLKEYVKVPKISNTTIRHNILEQIVYFHLYKIGKVERTTIATHYKMLNHVPDMIYTTAKGSKVYVEVEITKKSKYRYHEIMKKIIRDKPDKLLYISDTNDRAKSIVTSIGYWDNKLKYMDIDTFLKNVIETRKINPHSHNDPNVRPRKIISQRANQIHETIRTEKKEALDVIEVTTKVLPEKVIAEMVPNKEVKQNIKIQVSDNIEYFDKHKTNIKSSTKATKYINIANKIIDGIAYRIRTVYYGFGFALLYGGSGYWLYEKSDDLFSLIDWYL